MKEGSLPKITKNGYQLTKAWFDFVFEAKEPTRPIHAALYMWIVELNNRLKWKEVIGLPTEHSMQAIGVKGYQHYKKTLNDLARWGFITIVSKSHNQYTSNQISLNMLSTLSANQGVKQSTKQGVNQGRHNKTVKTIKTDKTVKKKIADAFSTDYLPSNPYERLAYMLWKQIYDDFTQQSIRPTNLLKAKASSWTNHIRLMIESDHRTETEIEGVLTYLAGNDFWRGNIQSAEKLRKQFERLQAEAKKSLKKSIKTPSSQQDLTKMNYYLKP